MYRQGSSITISTHISLFAYFDFSETNNIKRAILSENVDKKIRLHYLKCLSSEKYVQKLN